MIVKLLTEHHLKFLSLKVGCRGSSESTLVKMSNCSNSHAVAQMVFYFLLKLNIPDGPEYENTTLSIYGGKFNLILLGVSLTEKAAPHECVVRTSRP